MNIVKNKLIVATALSVSAFVGASAFAENTTMQQPNRDGAVNTQNEQREQNRSELHSNPANPAHPNPVTSTQKADGKDISQAQQSVQFDLNSDELKEKEKSKLDDMIESINGKDGEIKVELVGYSDSTGEDEYNKDLAERRVESVKKYLSENLEDKEVSFDTDVKGEENPVASNESAFGREKNRRVEVIITQETEDELVIN